MNQEKLFFEFVWAVYKSDELDYIELVLLSVTKSPKVANFVKRVFQLVRSERPKQLAVKH